MAIEKDLKELKDLALGSGAVSAGIIPAHEVMFDVRQRVSPGLVP